MKKALLFVLAAAMLGLANPDAGAAEESALAKGNAGNPVDQLTGDLWLKSTEREKGAFLFGIESAITVEYFVNAKGAEKAAKDGRRPTSNLSPFEKGWMEVFKGVERSAVVKQVDDWYAANPDRLNRPVLGVIWFELIAPNLNKKTD